MTGKQALKALYETMPLVFEESRKATHYLEIIEKEIKVLEIIKKYMHIYCVAPNDIGGGVRIWFTEDGEHYIDIPQEEYDIVKDVLTQK